MSVTQWAKWFGIVLLVVGVLGFVPGITSGGMLLGLFMVNGLHNIVHLLTGALLFVASRKGESASRMCFKIFGVVYLLVVLLALVMHGQVLGMAMNGADTLLHVVIAALALWLGFGGKKSMAMPSAQMGSQM